MTQKKKVMQPLLHCSATTKSTSVRSQLLRLKKRKSTGFQPASLQTAMSLRKILPQRIKRIRIQSMSTESKTALPFTPMTKAGNIPFLSGRWSAPAERTTAQSQALTEFISSVNGILCLTMCTVSTSAEYRVIIFSTLFLITLNLPMI